jgi:hypothetical protein
MREKITKAFTLFIPMSFVCWYLDKPVIAVIVFAIGFFATLELINLEINDK